MWAEMVVLAEIEVWAKIEVWAENVWADMLVWTERHGFWPYTALGLFVMGASAVLTNACAVLGLVLLT